MRGEDGEMGEDGKMGEDDERVENALLRTNGPRNELRREKVRVMVKTAVGKSVFE